MTGLSCPSIRTVSFRVSHSMWVTVANSDFTRPRDFLVSVKSTRSPSWMRSSPTRTERRPRRPASRRALRGGVQPVDLGVGRGQYQVVS